MGKELELVKVQQSGDVVLRREDSSEDDGMVSFYVLTSGFALGTTASFIADAFTPFGVIMLGAIVGHHIVESWGRFRRPKVSDLDYYSVLQLESLTKSKAPITLHKEIKAMRASLTEGEILDIDPFAMMVVPRPEGNNQWASITKKGLNLYLKDQELTEIEWDTAFADSDKSEPDDSGKNG